MSTLGRWPTARRQGLILLLLSLGVFALCLCGFDYRASAEERWQPTVSTTAGGEVASRLEPPAVQKLQPLAAPPPLASSMIVTSHDISTVPQGAWSPIITGALPSAAEGVRDNVAPDRMAETTQRPQPQAAASPQSASSRMQGVAPAAVPAVAAAPPNAPLPLQLQRPLEALPPDATAAQQYCFNTTDSAADARFAWQTKKIKEMETELDKRAEQLEAKTQEYKTWLARRDDFSRKAQDKLVAFYAKMRPDAAALQLAAMDEETAAALLTKLEPKVASLVLAEIEPVRAAKLAAIISGAAKIPPERRQRPLAPVGVKREDGTAADAASRTRS